MTVKKYTGSERRQFVRLDYVMPLACKVCKRATISKLFQGYTMDVSKSGLMCTMKDRVKKNDIVWLSFNKTTLSICEDLERRTLVYQNGIVGKVVRIKRKTKDAYSVGIQFLTREEKNLSNIYPKIFFLDKKK